MHIDFVRQARILRLIHTARCHVLLTLPAAVARPDEMADIAAAESKAAAGATVLIYVPRTQGEGRNLQKVDHIRLVKSGVEIRQTAHFLTRMAVVDHTMLVVARNRRDYSDGGLICRDLPFTSMIIRSLSGDTAATEPYPPGPAGRPDGEVSGPLAKEVVRQLATGAKDEAGARELGLPLRTYQRLVARIMKQLDARSRFQAGYLAAQQRLL